MEIVYDTELQHSDHLEHHGIEGQKWGVRRFQNANGSLTSMGRLHYGVGLKNKSSQLRSVERRYDPNARDTFTYVSRNKHVLDRVKRDYNRSETKVTKLQNKGAPDKKIKKAIEKSNKAYAKVEMEKALQNAMKRMELENINNGTYARNVIVNAGKIAAGRFIGYAGAYGIASATGGVGIAYSANERRAGTSLTPTQFALATLEARKAFEKALASRG